VWAGEFPGEWSQFVHCLGRKQQRTSAYARKYNRRRGAALLRLTQTTTVGRTDNGIDERRATKQASERNYIPSARRGPSKLVAMSNTARNETFLIFFASSLRTSRATKKVKCVRTTTTLKRKRSKVTKATTVLCCCALRVYWLRGLATADRQTNEASERRGSFRCCLAWLASSLRSHEKTKTTAAAEREREQRRRRPSFRPSVRRSAK